VTPNELIAQLTDDSARLGSADLLGHLAQEGELPEDLRQKVGETPLPWLESSDPSERDTAAYVLGSVRYHPAAPRLARILQEDPAHTVRICALASLLALRGQDARSEVEAAYEKEADSRVCFELERAVTWFKSNA